MIPVLTPEQMAGVDRAATEPVEVLIARAGYCVARAARRLLGGTYGRRILVLAGRGHNGADGRVAADVLRQWGASVRIIAAADLEPGEQIGGSAGLDLIVDAAYGTGLSRPYAPPDPGQTPVLAVDIPSGLSGLTGRGDAMRAEATVTFEALKPGLLLGSGPEMCGTIEVAAIGLSQLVADAAHIWLVTDRDTDDALPGRPREAHKWQTAVEIIGGSPFMQGAPLMAARAAMRSGSGYALVGVPGLGANPGMPPGEQVGLELPEWDWDAKAAQAAGRVGALAIGPGLGPRARGRDGNTGTGTPVARVLMAAETAGVPAVVDADGINALGSIAATRQVVDGRRAPTVLTPHAGEYERLTGHKPLDDRITDVRETASQTGAVVLLKGSCTVVAEPGGRVLLANSGSSRLATAGTGDVLSGIIAAFLARGVPALEAAALAAHVHGRAASMGRSEGLVASDLPDLVSDWLSARAPGRDRTAGPDTAGPDTSGGLS